MIVVAKANLTLTLDTGTDVYFGLREQSAGADPNYLILPLVVGLAAAVMAAVSLPLGPLLRSMPPLRAYAIDIAGSLAGIALFAGLSALGTTPAVWFALLAVLLALLGLARGVTAWAAVTAACLLIIVGYSASLGDTWSPYQRLTVYQTADNSIGIDANEYRTRVSRWTRTASRSPSTPGRRWFPGRPTTTSWSSSPAPATTRRWRSSAVPATSTRSRSTPQSSTSRGSSTPPSRTPTPRSR